MHPLREGRNRLQTHRNTCQISYFTDPTGDPLANPRGAFDFELFAPSASFGYSLGGYRITYHINFDDIEGKCKELNKYVGKIDDLDQDTQEALRLAWILFDGYQFASAKRTHQDFWPRVVNITVDQGLGSISGSWASVSNTTNSNYINNSSGSWVDTGAYVTMNDVMNDVNQQITGSKTLSQTQHTSVISRQELEAMQDKDPLLMELNSYTYCDEKGNLYIVRD